MIVASMITVMGAAQKVSASYARRWPAYRKNLGQQSLLRRRTSHGIRLSSLDRGCSAGGRENRYPSGVYTSGAGTSVDESHGPRCCSYPASPCRSRRLDSSRRHRSVSNEATIDWCDRGKKRMNSWEQGAAVFFAAMQRNLFSTSSIRGAGTARSVGSGSASNSIWVLALPRSIIFQKATLFVDRPFGVNKMHPAHEAFVQQPRSCDIKDLFALLDGYRCEQQALRFGSSLPIETANFCFTLGSRFD